MSKQPKNTLKVSVRKIVDFLCMEGALGSPIINPRKMQEGIEFHGITQGRRQREIEAQGGIYQKEKSLSTRISIGPLSYQISGRADGMITNADKTVTIEEIKSTEHIPRDAENIPKAHLAQAYFYGYMLATADNLEAVTISVLYGSLKTTQLTVFTFDRSASFLDDFFHTLMAAYHQWIFWSFKRKKERNISIKTSLFPYEHFRKNQRDFSVAVFTSIVKEKNLYAQAPTGTGKTIATLFPSIKAMGEKYIDFIFYATAKTITRTVAYNTLLHMQEKGYQVTVLQLASRENLCSYNLQCQENSCPYVAGNFDRLLEALWELLQDYTFINPTILKDFSTKKLVCPYSLASYVSPWVDIVIGDFNHLFDPESTLLFLEEDKKASEMVFLIDEAHNLVDRSRDMYAATLSDTLFKDIAKKYPIFEKNTHMICNYMQELVSRDPKTFQYTKDDFLPLLHILAGYMEHCEEILSMEDAAETADVLSIYFMILQFLKRLEFSPEGFTYLVYEQISETFKMDTPRPAEITLEIFCIDPSFVLAPFLRKAKTSIFFSGTFSPLGYFKEILAGKPSDFHTTLPSPFPPENLHICIENRISTYYQDRKKNYATIATKIYEFINSKKGNYLAFFPSYLFMETVHRHFIQMYPDIETIFQERQMTQPDKEAFLSAFEKDAPITAFAILGGHFSEGIDLPLEALIGVFICGVGLPPKSMRKELIKDYFDQKNNHGFAYAYQMPAINKVAQSGGRLIRTEKDTGIIFLLDTRFSDIAYKNLFPKEWVNQYLYDSPHTFSNIWKLLE